MKHTPGKWEITGPDDKGRFQIRSENGNVISPGCDSDTTGEVSKANRARMERACNAHDDLLEAAKRLMDRRNKCFIPDEDGLTEAFQNAIAKAGGNN